MLLKAHIWLVSFLVPKIYLEHCIYSTYPKCLKGLSMAACMDNKDLKDTRDIWHEPLERGASTKIQWVWFMQEGVIATKQWKGYFSR